ncbi:uncharacterized protein CANTADRAFT_91344 [Suhomyces tanzawaensis NRRL Y-17324]|uniref:Lipid droplet-associated serine hydrolase n=1 Tax=Suhomyces tanzawaensis NRRL Y-17324 TaxID=984487 RepID=A0A1E4SEE5_9ASCO|nr:uncharacterized protein CANTADRAFT_91344 [Suhomyces tanzawaensis NRRL Y-17324]ODV77891.1 hypothetical protein CANTADRAFT_91344 [Suhomyces tanzawaensis NRRL Y-17324]
MITTHPSQPCTSYYHKLAVESAETARLLMFIPGNPGLVEYYTTYLDLLQEQFPTLEIVCASHAGYQTTKSKDEEEVPYKYYGLKFQTQHKHEILKEHILRHHSHGKKVDLYFLSHSMGSYVLQRLIVKLNEDVELKGKFKIKLGGFICPTIIDIAQSDSGVLFTKLTRYLPIVPVLVFFSTLLQLVLSEHTIRRIIGRFVVSKPKLEDDKSLESWANSITGCYNIFRDGKIIRHAIDLAREEMTDIVRDDKFNDWYFQELPLQGTKLWSFFALKDHWVHDHSRSYLLSRYHNPEKNVVFNVDELEDGITHSFCVDQTVEFANITFHSLRRLFPDLQPGSQQGVGSLANNALGELRNRAPTHAGEEI